MSTNKKKTLEIKDFEEMAEKGIKRIVMSKYKYQEFSDSFLAKEREKYSENDKFPSDLEKVGVIHTDFGNIFVRTEENNYRLHVGQEVLFDSQYDIGDLVKYQHSNSEGKAEDERTHYSKIIRILPSIDDTSFVLKFKYVMENARVVPFEDVLSLEKKNPMIKVELTQPVVAF